jgi:hypothetical protein
VTDAGGVLGREALDCRHGGEGRRSPARVLLDAPRRVLSWLAQTDGVFWDRELSITGHNPRRR